MVSIVPYYRKERGSIIIRVIVDGSIVKIINTGLKISSAEWDEECKKVIGHVNKKLYNQKINAKVSEIQAAITKADLSGTKLTRDRVKRIAEGNQITTDFYKHCEEWIKEKYSNPDTIKAAMSDLNKVNGFAPTLQFGDIDKRWLMKYEKYLKEVLGNEGNTPWKAMKFLRTMLYDAESIGGIVHTNPFRTKEYKMPRYKQPEKDGLHIEEIDRIEKLFDEPHPVIIKIMAAKFLFMCYSGLRVSDAKRFTAEHLKNGERIVITSKKTGITTDLLVYDRLKRILERMNELPKLNIADSNLNKYLKTIAGLAGIDRLVLTSHVGRHTFGCLLAEMGISEEEAQQLLGHKNKTYTRVYYKLRQPQIDKAAIKLNNLPSISNPQQSS